MPAVFFDVHANSEQLQPASLRNERAKFIMAMGGLGSDEARHKAGEWPARGRGGGIISVWMGMPVPSTPAQRQRKVHFSQ